MPDGKQGAEEIDLDDIDWEALDRANDRVGREMGIVPGNQPGNPSDPAAGQTHRPNPPIPAPARQLDQGGT